MTAIIIEIADAVVAELNASALFAPCVAERSYAPLFELSEMKDLHVTVVPRGKTTAAHSRATTQEDVAIDVAIQMKLDKADNEEIDALMELVDQIAEYFKLKRLTACPDAAWIGTEYRAIFSPEHLAKMRQFTSVLSLTFRIVR